MEAPKKVSAADVATKRALRGYKVYTALLKQGTTDPPAAVILENTLSAAIVWTRASAGMYEGTLVGEFTANKTVCNILQKLTANNITDIVQTYRASVDAVHVLSLTDSTTMADELLDNTVIEIRVYP